VERDRSEAVPAQRDHAGLRRVWWEAVRNDDGSPVVRCEPILTREKFEAVRVSLDSRAKRGEPTKASSSLLLRVLHCGTCGEPAYKYNGGSHAQFPRYRCRSMTKAHKCGNRTIRVDESDETVERFVLAMLGESERLERVWDSGSDSSTELAELNDELADLADQLGSPAFRKGTPQRERLDARIEALATRQAALEAEATKPAGWTWQPTGEKFGDWWARQDVTGQNVWLRSMRIRLEFEYVPDDPSPNLRLDLGDLGTLTQQLNASGPVARWQEVFKDMKENNLQGITIGPAGSVAFTSEEA
jgi:site-specific DNA recombinase